MAKAVGNKRSWLGVLGLALVAGVVVPLVVLGGSQEQFTATPYADLIRFQAAGVASLQVQILDTSGRRLWDSGVERGSTVDWNRANTWGERLAYGAYLYQAMGWNSAGDVVFSRSGRLALMPGDQVQLQVAPPVTPPESPFPPDSPITLEPMQHVINDDLEVYGKISTFQSGAAMNRIDVFSGPTGARAGFQFAAYGRGVEDRATFTLRTDQQDAVFSVYDGDAGSWLPAFQFRYLEDRFDFRGNQVDNINKLGIGTTSPAAAADIRNTANQPALRIAASSGTNLIEAHNTGSGTATGLVFRVERASGDVRADGAFYGAGFHTGSADLAEHINASETLEPGDVVEIDPEYPQHFRLSSTAGSRLVAGVISTEPGVVLGSNADPIAGDVDTRPILALAGRVPVKATTENGAITPGDILISASRPGFAMRCDDPHAAIGMIIGKALEPLDEGEGLIMIQVTLR